MKRDNRLQLEELFAFINEDIGEINLRYEKTLICYRQRRVGAFLEPPLERESRPYCLDPQ